MPEPEVTADFPDRGAGIRKRGRAGSGTGGEMPRSARVRGDPQGATGFALCFPFLRANPAVLYINIFIRNWKRVKQKKCFSGARAGSAASGEGREITRGWTRI
jgi:hypothetical protein